MDLRREASLTGFESSSRAVDQSPFKRKNRLVEPGALVTLKSEFTMPRRLVSGPQFVPGRAGMPSRTNPSALVGQATMVLGAVRAMRSWGAGWSP